MEYSDSGVVGNRYVHGPGIDDPLAARVGSTNYYFFKDAQGSIVEVVQGYNSVYNSFIYDTYGNMVRFCGGGCGTPRAVYNGDVPGDLSIPYRYTGREWDDETGLYYYRARYYDPSVGRFLSKDPIGFEGGWNLYAYVNGNPVNYIDPWGLKDENNGSGWQGPLCITWECVRRRYYPDIRSGEAPDYTICSYYDDVARQNGCNYHANSGDICRGNNFWVNSIVKACRIEQSQLNDIRKCLVDKDKEARACGDTTASKKQCTKKEAIDAYHNECFTRNGVPRVCYGGNWGPYNNDGN